MAIEVDEVYEGKGYGQGTDGKWFAERVFHVFGTDPGEEGQAVSAVISQKGVTRNSLHPRNSACKCDSIGVSGNLGGPTAWAVRATYSIPEAGSHPEGVDEDVDPLSLPAKVRWSEREKEIPMEYDLDGRLVCNSAGYPPETPYTRTIRIDVLEITRYEPFYDRARAVAYRNRVNDTACTIGSETFDIGQIYCSSISPASEYEWGASAILMRYAFEFDNHAQHPYQLYFPDKGSYGWVTVGSDTVSGPIGVTSTVGGVTEFTQVTEPVLLDGTGKPVDAVYKVGYREADGNSWKWTGGTPVSSPLTGDQYGQPSESDIPKPNSISWIRRYRRTASADFSQLGL